MLFNLPGMISLAMHFPHHFSKIGLAESDNFDKSHFGPGSSSLASEGVTCKLLALLLEEPLALLWNLMVQLLIRKFFQRSGDTATSCM